MRFVAGGGAVAELLVRAAGESSWPGRRGGAAGTGSQRKQLAGALRRDGAKRQSVRKSLPLGGRLCGCIVEKLAAGRATPLRQREGAEQHREEAEQHREELSSIGKRLNGSNQHFTPFLFQCHRPHIAIPIITKYNSAA